VPRVGERIRDGEIFGLIERYRSRFNLLGLSRRRAKPVWQVARAGREPEERDMAEDWTGWIDFKVTEASVYHVASSTCAPNEQGHGTILGHAILSRRDQDAEIRQEFSLELDIRGQSASEARAKREEDWSSLLKDVSDDVIGIIFRGDEQGNRRGYLWVSPSQFDKLLRSFGSIRFYCREGQSERELIKSAHFSTRGFDSRNKEYKLSVATDLRPRAPRTSHGGPEFAVQLDEVEALTDSQLRFSTAHISGRIIEHPTKLPPNCKVDVTIVEYESDWNTDAHYPDEAFPGTFSFTPDYSAWLGLTLHFTRRDFEVLMPVILGSPTVILLVSLSATEAEMVATKEQYLRGEIKSYRFIFKATKGQ
jgi:hypothetical protein